MSESYAYCVCACGLYFNDSAMTSASTDDLLMHYLDKYIETQAVDVVDITQSKQAGEEAAGQHAHC